MKFFLQVGRLQVEVFYVEVGNVFPSFSNRIGFSEEVPPLPVAVDQVDHFEFGRDGFTIIATGGVFRSGKFKSLKKGKNVRLFNG